MPEHSVPLLRRAMARSSILPWVFAFGLCACGVTLGTPGAASASDTHWWTAASSKDYAGAESRGLVIDADGVIGLGPSARMTPVDSLDIVWSAAVLADGSVALGGEDGRIVRWTSGGVRPWVRLAGGQVLSLAADGDGVIAGTGPDGLVYRVRANGDTTLLARTGERYVWALVPADRDAWYAATGTRGRILRVGAKGTIDVLLDSDETNIVSMIADGHGGVYAGGDSRGRVLQVRSDGSARTLFDAPQEEIRALALTPEGAVLAAALTTSAVQHASGEDDEDRPRPARRSPGHDQAVLYRILPDSVVTPWWSAPQASVFALAAGPEGVIAATGNRAALYLLESRGRATQWLNAPQGQITALVRGKAGDLFAATSNPAAVWHLRPGERREGELISPAFDAERTARFGALRWSGEASGAHVEIRTRSGNTAEPDTTWTPWRGGAVGPDGSRVEAPAGRYLQWKLSLEGGRPRIESIEVAWRENNVPPWVEGVRIAPQGEGFRNGRLSQRTEPVTQEIDGGRRVEFSLKHKPSETSRDDLPLWVQGLRVVQWSAEDPNDDPLRYRLDVQRAGEAKWWPVAADLEDSVYVWDSRTVRDGRYLLRVTASDLEGNAIGEEREGDAVSPSFTVDNAAPTIDAFEARGEPGRITLRGTASDATGPVARIEVSLDDGEWRPITPAGGIADRARATFTGTLAPVDPGPHLVNLRVIDRAGNFATRAERVTVGAGR